MNQTIDWINTIIKELVDPEKKLKDILLKVQVLAFKIKNPKLKEWVENELNGYIGKEVPKYRKIPTIVIGNLEQDRGFGGMLTRNHQPLPIEYLNKDLRDELMVVKITQNVAELELMTKKDGEYQINIPYVIHSEITKVLGNNWTVSSAWQKITLSSIEGILNSIKSNLLTFMLELSDEIGEQDNIDIMEHKTKIDKLFDKSIGNVTGETVNISIGTNNIQSVNSGEKANVIVAKGKKSKQTINVSAQEELVKFISELKPLLENLSLDINDKQDIANEITRIETQIEREKPKYPIINEALRVINGIFIGVAANTLTPTILEKLGWLISQFS